MTNPNSKGSEHPAEALNTPKSNAKDWKILDNLALTHMLDHTTLQAQITTLSTSSKALEAKNLPFLVQRKTCITDNKLFKWKILDTPKCTLCNNPTQDSAHRFYFCPQAELVWQTLSNITKKSPCPHTFTYTTAILNALEYPKNHPIIILTNLIRLLIDKAHISGNKIHPNTLLFKLLNYTRTFQKNDLKYEIIWGYLADSCSDLLSHKNPQESPV